MAYSPDQVAYSTARATLPLDGRAIWLTLSENDLLPVPEVRDWVLFLIGQGRATETIRAYVPRVTLFLNWTVAFGCDWRHVTLPQMARFKHYVEGTPGARGLPRAPRSINAVLTSVIEFLRYCSYSGAIEPSVASQLSEQRYLVRPLRDLGGSEAQVRIVRARVLRVRDSSTAPEVLGDDTIRDILGLCSRPRDQLFIRLLLGTGLRVGEALSLRRSDIHFLPDSALLGCGISGPHLHVVPRHNNSNRSSTKSRNPRFVPVAGDIVRAYADYMAEREGFTRGTESDFVFVNLYSSRWAGAPMTYSNVKQWFDRLGRVVGADVRPHMLRHTAATRWLHEGGAELDTVQALLGHANASSTAVYLHPREQDLRDAVSRVDASQSRSGLVVR